MAVTLSSDDRRAIEQSYRALSRAGALVDPKHEWRRAWCALGRILEGLGDSWEVLEDPLKQEPPEV